MAVMIKLINLDEIDTDIPVHNAQEFIENLSI
jgi:hypothetical protein